MKAPGYRLDLADREGYLHAVISGEKDSYDVTMGAVRELAGICRTRGIRKLLVEHKVPGQLSTVEIFKIASEVPALYGETDVAFVVHLPTRPDNPSFLQDVSRNRGGRGRLFADAREAEAWLKSL